MRRVLDQVARSRAAWFFAGTWIVAVVVLLVSGQGLPVLGILVGGAYLLLSLLTVLLTRPAPHPTVESRARPRLWLQLGLVVLFVLLTASAGLAFHGVIAPDAVPIWSALLDVLDDAGQAWLGNGNYLVNPVTYFVLPLILLLLAGARPTELGFGRGHRMGTVLVLWSAVPIAFFAYALLSGLLSAERLVGRLVSNFMQNGFFEEFLFRGALQTRLRRLTDPGWALVMQALIFGAWHLGLGYTNTEQAGLLPALASVIVVQAVMGLAFGVIIERTRNLLAPSVAHVLGNSVG